MRSHGLMFLFLIALTVSMVPGYSGCSQDGNGPSLDSGGNNISAPDSGQPDGGNSDSGITPLGFDTDIKPITTSVCAKCHGSNPSNYTWIKSNWVDTGKMRNKLNSGHPSALDATDKAKMIQWLDEGALP